MTRLCFFPCLFVFENSYAAWGMIHKRIYFNDILLTNMVALNRKRKLLPIFDVMTFPKKNLI